MFRFLQGYQDGEPTVKMDAQRFVEIASMFQKRFDDASKHRVVKRVLPKKKPAKTNSNANNNNNTQKANNNNNNNNAKPVKVSSRSLL